jgi:uncharacterized damage-inducible protein DinB
MNPIDRLLKQYDAILTGAPWHGDAIWSILDGISPEAAAARPLPNAHTIWEIVMHMIFWEYVGAKRLHGERAGLVETEVEGLNFPPMPAATKENWKKTLDDFRTSNQTFRGALAALDAAKLDQLTAAGKRTYYGEAHGVMEHDVYHAGQIAVLKKG